MAQAIEDISKLNIAYYIAIAEKNIFETEEDERKAVKIVKRKGLYSVYCKYCGVLITHGNQMRHVNKKMYLVCDKQVLDRIFRRHISKVKQKTIDGFREIEKADGLKCRHNWGSIFRYRETEFLSLAKEHVIILDRQTGESIDCRKWSDLVFKIEHMSDDDFLNYTKKDDNLF